MRPCLLIFVVLATPAVAARKLVELTPAKGLMLMKTWQARAENMNVLKTVPDGKTGKKLKVVSIATGEEATRRALCKEEFKLFSDRVLSLASADAGDYPQAKRQVIPELKIAGAPRGLGAKLFANLGEGASTLSIVEALDTEWNVLSLCVSPDARRLESIVEAEVSRSESNPFSRIVFLLSSLCRDLLPPRVLSPTVGRFARHAR